MSLITEILVHSWEMLNEAAPYLWLGLLAAGALHVWVPQEWIMSQLGGRGQGSVWKAALLGVPIPLCSCGVIPATIGLRRRGAGKGATLSFLISTPETSADSIALTWAMLGPVWAIIRPVAAVATAVLTGTAANFFPDEDDSHIQEEDCVCCEDHAAKKTAGVVRAWNFIFKKLLPDIGGWLLLGILLSGLVLAFLPSDLLETLPGGVWSQMLLALAVGIPLYICAAASTPLVAALLIKGLAPGAALVLLLAGPATNMASALVISRQLGRVGTVVYFSGVTVGSLAAGALVQLMAPRLQLSSMPHQMSMLPVWFSASLAVLLVALVVLPWLARARLAWDS